MFVILVYIDGMLENYLADLLLKHLQVESNVAQVNYSTLGSSG